MAKSTRKAALWIMAVPITAWLMVIGVAGKRQWLVSSEPVQVYAVLPSSQNPPPVAMILPPGQRLPVTRCIDTKSFIEVEVALPDGGRGYAWLDYRNLKRQSVFAFWGAPLTYSCP